MGDMPEDALGRTRSLRIRKTRVDYSEDESEESTTSHPKRGSKRKAEVNIESLYCQENVKDVSPSSLETIFESPQKGPKGGRSKSNKILKNANEMAAETQVMSIKKWKRFCSFADYYHPSKKKTKLRKDRAKKLKQLTGVKVPVGYVTDEDLQTVLSVLSEDEDQNDGLCMTNSSFYSGNIIRPDVEDPSVNDVIKNISSLKMITESCDEEDLLLKGFMEAIDEPLPFFSEKGNPLPQLSQQKKSRRRSEKFSGCLLPRSVKGIDNEVEEFREVRSSDVPDNLSDDKTDCLDRSRSEQILTEEITMKNAPKRRNVLNDKKKVVKKPKCLETTLKRQSESKEEQCQKKRGNIKSKESKTTSDRQSEVEDCAEVDFRMRKDIALHHDFENSVDVTNQLLEYQISGSQQLGNLSCSQGNQGSLKGRKRGKRRVSGIQRPLYRTVISSPSPEAVFNESLNHDKAEAVASPLLNTSSSPLHEVNHRYTSANMTPVTVSSVQNGTPQIFPSPTSPCTQMAALSLQSDREVVNNLKQGKPKKRTRRRSEQFSRASLGTALPPSSPVSTATSLPSQPSIACSTAVEKKGLHFSSGEAELSGDVYGFKEDFREKSEISRKVPSRNRKRLSNVFSQCELNSVVEEENGNAAGAIVVYPDAVSSNSAPCLVPMDCRVTSEVRSNYAESDVMNRGLEENCVGSEALQQRDIAFSDDRSADEFILPQTNCAIVGNIPPTTSDVKLEDHVDSVKKVVNLYNVSSQHDGRNVGNLFKTSNVNREMSSESEGADSPIITGMIESKASIRCGKVYPNKISIAASPIMLGHFGELQKSLPRTYVLEDGYSGGK